MQVGETIPPCPWGGRLSPDVARLGSRKSDVLGLER